MSAMKKVDMGETEVALYAKTKVVHPRWVKGTFRSLKWWGMLITLAWWHLAPFMRWDRGPNAPDQAVMIDMAGRRAYFFFIEIWPQEVYYLTGLLLFAAITLFMMSALAGRVWCGFLCWQTVYTDLFVAIDHWINGDRAKRIALERAPWTPAKLVRRAVVHGLWLLISFACGLGFVLYFGDAFEILEEIFSGRAEEGTWAAIAVVGGGCYLLGGFAREQVCIYMCPYSRFQAAMFDEHSLLVSYEEWRGEPRAPARLGQSFEGRGHCVDCKMCVTSCPTGIDIRNGSQLACIGCALCIDACNAIMDKHGLPRGLISYDSSANQEARGCGKSTRLRLLRPRILVYVAILAAVGTTMLVSLAMRSTTEVNVQHERSPLFVAMSDGQIRNGYTYKILNMVREDRTFTLTTEGIDGVRMEIVGGDKDVETTRLVVPGDEVGTFRIYVTAPRSSLGGKATDIVFVLSTEAEGVVEREETVFAAPEK